MITIVTGYPGYDSIIGLDNASIGEILKENGYATSWFGKNHNTPAFQYSVAGRSTSGPACRRGAAAGLDRNYKWELTPRYSVGGTTIAALSST